MRVRGEVDVRDEETETLEDVSRFEDPERGCAEEAEGERPALGAWPERQTGFHEDEKRARENDEDD